MIILRNLAIFFAFITLTLLPETALAHCPLCTAGAGVLALIAASIGISTIVVGLFIGAFSLALGIWIARSIKKKYIKYQFPIISIVIFLGTILPIMPLIREYRPLYISLFGQYGTLFHNTYTINLYLLGAVLGAALLFISPFLSRYLTKISGKKMPYQSMIITFGLLIILGVILQFTVK